MSAGKNIEIKIAATGGAEAAREFGKLETSIREVQAEVDKLASNDYSPENQKLLRDKQEELSELKIKYLEAAEAAEAASEASEKVGRKSNIAGAALVGAGIGGAFLGKQLAEIRKGFESLDVEKLRGIDAAMADQIQTAKGWAEVLTDPINGIQRLISGTTIAEAFAEANDQLARAAQQQAEAVDRVIMNGRRTAEQLREVAREIAAANAILDARDDADASERDKQDADRIRGGEAPEDVRADRAAYDRDRQLESINRKLEPKAATTQALFEESQQAAGNAQRAKEDPRATREDKERAAKEAEAARAAFERAKREYDAELAVAMEQRRGVRANFEGNVADAGFDKQTRLQKEAADKARKEAADQARKEREAKREAEAEQRRKERSSEAGRDLDNSAARFGSDAGEAARKLGRGKVGEILERAGSAIARKGEDQPGQDLEWTGKMISMMERLVADAESRRKGGSADAETIRNIKRQMEIFEKRMRNLG